MKTTPSPSRLRLDTSPPNDGGEDAPAARSALILSPHEVGERCRGEAETERGEASKASRTRFPIGPYFADFACRKERLVVEIDGSQHADSSYGRQRDEFMRSQGFSTLRFWNHDILKHRTSDCETILAALTGRLRENVSAFDLRFAYAGVPA
jgi:very-short-patch-repair endonuclease